MEHYQVTLTTADTAYNLKALVKAINSTFKDVGAGGTLRIEPDGANVGAIHLGGSTVTTGNYGVYLIGNESIILNLTVNAPLVGIWAVSGENAQKVNISIFR